MPKISSYPLITTVTDQDLFVISDSSNNDATKSLELETLKTYINEGGGAPGVTSLSVGLDYLTNEPTVHLSAPSGSVTVYGQTSFLTGDGTFGGSSGTGVNLELRRYLSNDSGSTNLPTSTIRLAQGNNIQITTAKVSTTDQITFSVVGDTITSLTTTGTSGAATFSNGVLNIPQYSGGGGGGGTVTSVDLTAGALIDVSGGPITTSGSITVGVDLSELTDMTDPMISTDEFVVLDSGVQKRKEASEIGLSIFNNDPGYTTNLGVVQSITTNGTSGAATLTNGVLNIPEYAGQAQATTWQAFYRKFTGSELRDAFNGSATDKITLIEVPADKMCILGIECTTFVDYSTGTTNYTFGTTQNLAIYPDTTNLYQYATSYSIEQNLLTSTSFPFGIRFKDTSTNYGSTGATGADIILARASGLSSVNITGGDRDFIITFTYRIIDLS